MAGASNRIFNFEYFTQRIILIGRTHWTFLKIINQLVSSSILFDCKYVKHSINAVPFVQPNWHFRWRTRNQCDHRKIFECIIWISPRSIGLVFAQIAGSELEELFVLLQWSLCMGFMLSKYDTNTRNSICGPRFWASEMGLEPIASVGTVSSIEYELPV